MRTFTELLAYNDWARDKLFACAHALSGKQLDQPFEIGPGSLRGTLFHLWAAERTWLDRWIDPSTARFPSPEPNITPAELHDRFRRAAVERNAFLAARTDADIDRPISYSNSKGEAYTFPLRVLLLHVCTHGSHHRAQAINMLRRLGAPLPRPGADYIFMKVEQQSAGAAPTDAPTLDLRTIRNYYAYADWARDRVHDAAEPLTDAQLDRPFEMGVGTLRRTLVHIRDAEQWWLDNWTVADGRPFPTVDENLPIRDLRRRFHDTAAARNALLDRMTDADLARVVRGSPRPGVVREFPIGVTMLQLCHHGTHHRAQVLNMLRHVGATPPKLDYLRMRLEAP